MKVCPFSDLNNDFCCSVALHGRESYENCYECACQMHQDLLNFLNFLSQEKNKGKEKN